MVGSPSHFNLKGRKWGVKDPNINGPFIFTFQLYHILFLIYISYKFVHISIILNTNKDRFKYHLKVACKSWTELG